MNNIRSYYHDDADYNKSKHATPTDSNGQRKASQGKAKLLPRTLTTTMIMLTTTTTKMKLTTAMIMLLP